MRHVCPVALPGRKLSRFPAPLWGNGERPPERLDPVQQVNAIHQGRLEWLIPIRVGLVASPYGFGEKLGELRISRGSLDWKPRGRRKTISIQWERSDRLVQETCS